MFCVYNIFQFYTYVGLHNFIMDQKWHWMYTYTVMVEVYMKMMIEPYTWKLIYLSFIQLHGVQTSCYIMLHDTTCIL
jgi:hypothetical protein